MAVQFSDVNNWQSIYRENIQAGILTSQPLSYTPIPSFLLPVQLSSNYVCIRAEAPNAKSGWRTAGYLSQIISTGLIAGGLPDAQTSSSFSILLNNARILNFPTYSTTYALSVNIHVWITSVILTVWEYIGTT